MTTRVRAPRREIFGWAMFDFANQAYTLLIITVVYGDLFTRVIVGDGDDGYRLGNLLWSLSLATSYLLVVATTPAFGAVMDYTASKKRFLFASYVATILATGALYFVEPSWVALAVFLIIVSNYAYSLGEAFIAGFLPHLGPPQDLGKISGFGWALGYIGGLAATAFTLLVLGEVSEENFERIRWVGPFAAAFFLVAAIPTFLWLREPGSPQPLPPGWGYVRLGYARVAGTVRRVTHFRDLAVMLASILFAQGGIAIIIAFSFIYGAQVIGWEAHVRGMMFVVVQIFAAAGALGFGAIQHRLGARRTYFITLWIWVAAIALIYLTPQISATVEALFGLRWEAQYVFLVVGSVAGVALGSCQSAGRTLVGLFSPLARSAEFFGFWGLSTKLAAAVALVAVGGLQALVGLQPAVLFCILLFVVAWLIGLAVDEERGRATAEGEPAP